MQREMYSFFEKLIKDSQIAFEYADEHFDQLMARPVAKVIYGPAVYGPGIAIPSRVFVPDKARELSEKNRRKQYRLYALDERGDILYSRAIRKNETIDCTYLHFWLGDTNYARAFYRDQKIFYNNIVFGTHYDNGNPVYFSMVDPDRVYVECFSPRCTDSGDEKIHCRWFDYYPSRQVSECGIILNKEAPFGAPNSPVSVGVAIFDPVNSDLNKWIG